MFPNPQYIAAIHEDRLREAEQARLVRSQRRPTATPARRRHRRFRAVVARIAFTR